MKRSNKRSNKRKLKKCSHNNKEKICYLISKRGWICYNCQNRLGISEKLNKNFIDKKIKAHLINEYLDNKILYLNPYQLDYFTKKIKHQCKQEKRFNDQFIISRIHYIIN